ncbi:UNVERIFIED_CONTAM: hypothetical protein GTU68_066667 [Idotea baltica]|nr:hypothetical protein [Idotea baltica]
MSVIVSRALPDVRDGLKPVAPAPFLYAMPRGRLYQRQKAPQIGGDCRRFVMA